MEFEAIDEGRIAQILVPEGTDNVKVGTVIATIAGEGEETSSNSVRAEPVEAPSLPSTQSEEKDSPSTSSGQTEEKARKPAPTERASDPAIRSEEHTSELQSLMRISYAVFCLKKKKTTPHISHPQHLIRHNNTTKLQRNTQQLIKNLQ